MGTSEAQCTLRDCEIALPGRSYCANHPDCGDGNARVPVGPVFIRSSDGPEILVESPDSREIRNALINMVQDSAAGHVDAMTPQEATALWQLERWDEPRAYVLRDTIRGETQLPGSLGESAPEDETAPSASEEYFLLPTLRARVLVVLLALNIVASLALIIGNGAQLELLDKAAVAGVTMAEAESNDARQLLLRGLWGLSLLPTVVVFLAWIYRAYANLRPLGAAGVRHSPAWAVGCWFIPIANFLFPCSVMIEIDTKSGREGRSSGSGLVMLWWLTWVAGNILWSVASRGARGTPGLAELGRSTWFSTFSLLSLIVAGGLAIAVVLRIQRKQAESNEQALLTAFD